LEGVAHARDNTAMANDTVNFDADLRNVSRRLASSRFHDFEERTTTSEEDRRVCEDRVSDPDEEC
jgi:hypothetical protein